MLAAFGCRNEGPDVPGPAGGLCMIPKGRVKGEAPYYRGSLASRCRIQVILLSLPCISMRGTHVWGR